MTEHTATDDGDFLDSGVHHAPDESSAAAPYGVATPGASGATGWKAAVRPAAWLASGVVAGAVVVAAWHSSQTSSVPPNPAAVQGQLPNGQPSGGQPPNKGQAPGGQAPGGQLPGGPPGVGGGLGPGFGGRDGEQHVIGTVTAVGASSVTVKLAHGSTAKYAVIDSSDIVKDGARVSLTAIKVGDTVFLHVYPMNGRTVVEHLFAGTRPSPGQRPGQPPDDSTDDGTTRT